MKQRSELGIILENLERLFRASTLKWCWMTHGPVPEDNSHFCQLSDKHRYDMRVLAWKLPQVELQYLEKPLQGIQKHYIDWVQEYHQLTGGKQCN